MCAAVAGQRGRRVLLLDHADAPGKKILISGGGRCNFTNLGVTPERFLSANRHFAKSALRRYTARDFITLVDRYGIAWHEKTLGQLFCDGSAKQIVAMLLEEAALGHVQMDLGETIREITHSHGVFSVRLRDREVTASRLVVATGGPSIPKMGATGFAYDVARQFGLAVETPRPALVPLTLDDAQLLFKQLSGVSADVIAQAGKTKFREACLFTHRGLSGPAILQASSYWSNGAELALDFTPDFVEGWLIDVKRDRPRVSLKGALSRIFADRLAAGLAERLVDTVASSSSGTAAELGNTSDKQLRSIEGQLRRWVFRPTGTEGYAKAEVTAGGVSTNELSSRSMEVKSVPGLYFIGEAVDVTGWLGGYNFQWAWSSGWAAGQDL